MKKKNPICIMKISILLILFEFLCIFLTKRWKKKKKETRKNVYRKYFEIKIKKVKAETKK